MSSTFFRTTSKSCHEVFNPVRCNKYDTLNLICESRHPPAQISGPYTWQKAYQPDGMGSYDLNVFQVQGTTLT